MVTTVESFDKLTTITAQIGDTLVGTIGVILGFITLIYIIETFKDQSGVNSHSKSTDNLHIILDLLKESSEITKSFAFEGKNGNQAFGFARVCLFLTRSDIPRFFVYTSDILNNILRLFESILLTARIKQNLHIDKTHKKVIGLKIKELLKGYVDIVSYIGTNYDELVEHAYKQKDTNFIHAISTLEKFLFEAKELGILGVTYDDEIEIVDDEEIKPLTSDDFVKGINESYLEEIYSNLEKRAFKVSLVDK